MPKFSYFYFLSIFLIDFNILCLFLQFISLIWFHIHDLSTFIIDNHDLINWVNLQLRRLLTYDYRNILKDSTEDYLITCSTPVYKIPSKGLP